MILHKGGAVASYYENDNVVLVDYMQYDTLLTPEQQQQRHDKEEQRNEMLEKLNSLRGKLRMKSLVSVLCA